MLHKQKQTTFYCFSPPIMLATFIIEFAMAGYALWRYKLSGATRLIVIVLLMLGTFQLAEYNVCGGYGMTAESWSRIGYVAISTLPPLGLHLMHVLAGRPQRRLVWFAYLMMTGFIAYFLLAPQAFRGYMCTGNYVIFQLGERAAIMYGAYYYGWLLAALSLGVRWLGSQKYAKKEHSTERNLVRALIFGYFVFLIPTAVANSVNPETRSGIPSIMCGFAGLFAFVLAFYILPRIGKRRT